MEYNACLEFMSLLSWVRLPEILKRFCFKDNILQVLSVTNEETMLLIFGMCHLSAMSLVCSNPIMYGFINENSKKVNV